MMLKKRCLATIISVTISFLLFYIVMSDKKTLEYEKTKVVFNKKYKIEAYIADNKEKQLLGLMGVELLPKNKGMIFEYKKTRKIEDGFWMYQTLIPLDIAFINKKNEIVSIKSMKPCKVTEWENAHKCPITYSDAPYVKAIEVNLGELSRNNVKVGDSIIY